MKKLEESKELYKSIKKPLIYTVSTYNPDDTINKISNQVFKFSILAKDRFNELKKKIEERMIPDTMICLLQWYNKYTYKIIDQYSIDEEYDGIKVGDIYSTLDDKNISS